MKKVITYGTFDLFHQGHYNILKRARELLMQPEKTMIDNIINRYTMPKP